MTRKSDEMLCYWLLVVSYRNGFRFQTKLFFGESTKRLWVVIFDVLGTFSLCCLSLFLFESLSYCDTVLLGVGDPNFFAGI
jgi:hypothetical protein